MLIPLFFFISEPHFLRKPVLVSWPYADIATIRTAFWALRSSFNYQGLPIFSSAISVDGSLLALAQGTVVTLWETSSNVLLKVFDTADIEGVRKVQFLGSEGRWLAFAGQARGVGVWDLLSCEGMSLYLSCA